MKNQRASMLVEHFYLAAIDRCLSSSLSDAKDALLNAVIDALKSYRDCSGSGTSTSAIFVPPCMKSYPLAINCLLKHVSG